MPAPRPSAGQSSAAHVLAALHDTDLGLVAGQEAGNGAAGFFATGKAVTAEKVSVDAHRPPVSLRFRWAAAVAVAASLALVAAIGLYHRQNDCYVLAYGEKSTDSQLALADMTSTLTDLFGESEDVSEELFDIFNPAL